MRAIPRLIEVIDPPVIDEENGYPKGPIPITLADGRVIQLVLLRERRRSVLGWAGRTFLTERIFLGRLTENGTHYRVFYQRFRHGGLIDIKG